MTFGESYWLWVLALVPMLAFVFFTNEKRSRELLQRIVAARLLDRLAGSFSPGRRRLRFAVLLLGIALLIVSMAHPQYGYTWEQSKRRGRDVLIAIDVSKSMLSTDVSPNRLTRARLAAEDLVGALQGDRAGVLAFAGSAFLQAPLTVDYGAVLDSINDLDTNTIPKGGTDIAAVIDEAAKAFGKGESENRCLILFTDGEELTANGVAAAKLHADEFRIFTVGVGTASGAIIPVSSGDNGTEFVKDPEGQIVKSKLDEKRLAEIAEATGGFYTHLEHGAVDMKKIVENGLGKIKEHDIDARMSRHPIERYQWPLGAGILFIAASLLISEKRRVKTRVRSGALKTARAAALLLIFGVMAQPARSEPLNPGVRFYNEKKYKDSYDAFIKQLKHDPDSQALEFDSGAAAYKNGDFDKAIEAFGKASTSTHPSIRAGSEYNLGNALCLRGVKQESKDLRLKDWTNSIQHYNEALKISPQNEDAKYNRDLVQKMIDDLKKEQQQQQNQQQKDDQKDKQDKKDQQKQQNQQNQKDKQQDKNQQQKQDQNSGQGQNKDQQQQQNKDQQQKGDKGQNGQDKDQQKNDQDRNKDQQQQQGGQQGQNKDQQQQNAKNQNKDQQQQQGGQQGQNKDQQQNARNQNKDQQQQQGDQGQDKDQQKKEQNQDQQNGQNPSPDNGNNSNDQQQQASQHPTPGQDEPGKKYSGQIKDAQQGQQQQEGQPGEQEKAYVPGEEREMTAAEAKRIVESEKNEEAKGVLIEHKASAPVLKDW